MPGIQRILQPLTEFLHCEVDDGSRAAPRGGARVPVSKSSDAVVPPKGMDM
ncbi:hypothetical protein I542_1551 [Mycobacteroides abscessus 1948]|uniref:Uncharacterized protein n=1 Tax=Mycobacteroides abscessus 1948 TaxID=1299323 RepID=A0A829QDV0_9MYCO|nr:hypothetical protein I542_1551 [Mycobacteroides abscessus 1948]